MNSTSSKVDLSTLHTPHKLAAFVVNILNQHKCTSESLTPLKSTDTITNNLGHLNKDEKDMSYNIYDPLQNDINDMDINLIPPPPFINEVILNDSIASEDEKHEQLFDEYEESSNTDTNTEDSISDSRNIPHEIYQKTASESKQEKNILLQIAKVLYEHSWSGEMISLSTQFNRSDYNALLTVGGISIDSNISNSVWKIISDLQKKVEDDLINENKKHIKWYWWDANINDIDYNYNWKWRKYNVIICEWISKQYKLYLNDNSYNHIEFKLCQQELQKNYKTLLDNKFDDIKEEMITIDPYFDKNDEYCHHLVIEKDEFDYGNILLWHKITNINNEMEYFREIRLDYKLLDVKQDIIVNEYEQYPSPFAIPPQLHID